MTGGAAIEPALIAQPGQTGTYAGAGIIDSTNGLWNACANQDWSAAAVGGVAVGLDVLGMVLNPLSELIKVGVGWAMEHFEFLREPLEVLTGDPEQIKAVAQSWENVAQHLNSAAQMHQEGLNKIGCWYGEASTAYRQTAAAYNGAIKAVSGAAASASQGIKVAATIVATERAIIFDLIASFISDLAAKLVIAAASAVISMGGSLGLFLADAVRAASVLAGRIMQRLRSLLRIVADIVDKLKFLGERGQNLSKGLSEVSYKLRDGAKLAARTRDPQRILDLYGKYTAAAGNVRVGAGTLGGVNDSLLVKTGKEGAKSSEDNWGMEGNKPDGAP